MGIQREPENRPAMAGKHWVRHSPQMDVETELLKVAVVIGEGTVTVTISEDISFPSEITQVEDTYVSYPELEATPLADKVRIRGILRKQIIYVEAGTGLEKHLQVEEPYTTFIDIPGCAPGYDVHLRPGVEHIAYALIPEGAVQSDQARQTCVLSIFVKVTATAQLNVVTDVTGPQITPIKELMKVETVQGEGTYRHMVTDTVTFPGIVHQVLDTICSIVITRTTPLRDKVVITGRLEKMIIYVNDEDETVRELSVEVPYEFTVDLIGTRPGHNITTYPTLEYIEYQDFEIHEITPGEQYEPPEYETTCQEVAVFSLFIKVTQTEQIEVVTSIEGPVEYETTLLKMESVVGEKTAECLVEQVVQFPQPVSAIIGYDARVIDIDADPIYGKVVAKGTLWKRLRLVSSADSTVYVHEVQEQFTTFAEIPGTTPQSNPHLIPTVEHVEHRLIPILGDPEGASFAAEQTSILDLFIKVTDTVQREVVTSVLYVPPSEDPCTPEHAETIIYVVKKGDTLWKIAKHFGTTIDKILKDNPWIENPSLIYPGQKITIHKCVP